VKEMRNKRLKEENRVEEMEDKFEVINKIGNIARIIDNKEVIAMTKTIKQWFL
jgi:hypothetical protein